MVADPGDKFKSIAEAAKDFVMRYNLPCDPSDKPRRNGQSAIVFNKNEPKVEAPMDQPKTISEILRLPI